MSIGLIVFNRHVHSLVEVFADTFKGLTFYIGEKKENVPFLTSTLIAYLKSMEDILRKEKILNFKRRMVAPFRWECEAYFISLKIKDS